MKIKKLLSLCLTLCLVLSSSIYTTSVFTKAATTTNDTIMVGTPTERTWSFVANKSGTYKLVFTYSRSWEKTTSDKTLEYTVKVTDENGADSPSLALTADKETSVKKGQRFTIILEENPSTGYSWSYNTDANAIQVLSVVAQPSMVHISTQKMWTFTAKKSGTYKIKFTKSNSPDQTVVYKIKVTNKNGSKAEIKTLDATKTNTLKKGQQFIVRLDENISTTTPWNYKADKKAVKLNSAEYLDNMTGTPDQKTWTFKADKSGTYKITFTYSRPWEKTSSDKTVEYTVKVTEDNSTDTETVILSDTKENTMKKGEFFSVTLEDNSSTGYSWIYNIEANAIALVE